MAPKPEYPRDRLRKPITITLSLETQALLRATKRATGIPMSQLIERAVNEALRRRET